MHSDRESCIDLGGVCLCFLYIWLDLIVFCWVLFTLMYGILRIEIHLDNVVIICLLTLIF